MFNFDVVPQFTLLDIASISCHRYIFNGALISGLMPAILSSGNVIQIPASASRLAINRASHPMYEQTSRYSRDSVIYPANILASLSLIEILLDATSLSLSIMSRDLPHAFRPKNNIAFEPREFYGFNVK